MNKVYQTAVSNLMERIEARREEGVRALPWKARWNTALGMPRNFASGHQYRGINLMLTLVQGYSSPYWITLKQLNGMGGRVRKGEHYTPIVFWKFHKEEQESGEVRQRPPICAFYKVWNIEQTEGIEQRVADKSAGTGTVFDSIAAAEEIVTGYCNRGGPEIRHTGGMAYYMPSNDTVTMPPREAFESAESYYSTLFHELAHSTGHRSRLERDGIGSRFQNHAYSEEELIAEMCAAMLMMHARIETPQEMDDSAAYLDHWLQKLKANPDWLVGASGQAQKAADKVLGVSFLHKHD